MCKVNDNVLNYVSLYKRFNMFNYNKILSKLSIRKYYPIAVTLWESL